jgi:hypothetical protein
MSRDEVADHLDIPVDQVRKAMSRAGIPHLSGWPRDEVEKLERPGKGWRAGQGRRTETTDCTCGHTRNYHVAEGEGDYGVCGYGRGCTCRKYLTDHTPNPEEGT